MSRRTFCPSLARSARTELNHWKDLVDESFLSLQIQCYAGEEVGAQKKAAKRVSRLQRKRLAEDTQFVQKEQAHELLLLRCQCGRPQANEAGGVVWCLFCPQPEATPPHTPAFDPPAEGYAEVRAKGMYISDLLSLP